MKNKFLKMVLCAALVLAVLPGCSDDEANGDGAATSSETTKKPPIISEQPVKDEAAIKEIYKIPEIEAAKYAEENTPSPLTYAGFDSHVFSTPVKESTTALMTLTPIYTTTDVHNYVHNNSALFDFGSGDNSFAAKIAGYSEEFFSDNALLIISFMDKEGGGSYKVVGGWDDELKAEGLEMSRFMFATKKTDGKITSGHIIVEIDPDFMGIWDSFGMEFYK